MYQPVRSLSNCLYADRVGSSDQRCRDSLVPVASPEALVAAVDPEGVNVGEEEGGQPPDRAGVLGPDSIEHVLAGKPS